MDYLLYYMEVKCMFEKVNGGNPAVTSSTYNKESGVSIKSVHEENQKSVTGKVTAHKRQMAMEAVLIKNR